MRSQLGEGMVRCVGCDWLVSSDDLFSTSVPPKTLFWRRIPLNMTQRYYYNLECHFTIFDLALESNLLYKSAVSLCLSVCLSVCLYPLFFDTTVGLQPNLAHIQIDAGLAITKQN